jgi:release factor glutamine methyltransferase
VVVLERAGVVAARREAGWLVESATRTDPTRHAFGTLPIDEDAARRALDLAHRRASGEPLQYITGVAGFRKLELRVGPGVFIPRPETELVAGRAMELLPHGGVAVDVGTGSGAIALSIAQERPDAEVYATEVSSDALAFARVNRERAALDVELIAGDLLSGLPEALAGRVDVVVSNPPYVPPEEARLLPRDVVAHEPTEALFAAGGGLTVIRRVALEARRWLAPKGWIVLEIGDRQGAAVGELLRAAGYREVAVNRDLTDRERIAEARR